MIKTLRVIAVNKPHGTMTVRWNNDPELEWNYNIPWDSEGTPFVGDVLLRYLVSEGYEQVNMVLDRRADGEKRNLANFQGHDALLRRLYNVEEMVLEYEAALSLTE